MSTPIYPSPWYAVPAQRTVQRDVSLRRIESPSLRHVAHVLNSYGDLLRALDDIRLVEVRPGLTHRERVAVMVRLATAAIAKATAEDVV